MLWITSSAKSSGRELDPINFHNVSRRLFELQGLQLPPDHPIDRLCFPPINLSPWVVLMKAADPIQAYSLPPMGNAKTSAAIWTSIDQILEQMQATILRETTLTSHRGRCCPARWPATFAYRTSNSPPSQPSAICLPLTALPPPMLHHQHQGSIASTADGQHPRPYSTILCTELHFRPESFARPISQPSSSAMYPQPTITTPATWLMLPPMAAYS